MKMRLLKTGLKLLISPGSIPGGATKYVHPGTSFVFLCQLHIKVF